MDERFRVWRSVGPWALLMVTSCSVDDAVECGHASVRASVISGQVAVDPVPVHQPVPGRWPAAAFAGGQYLVVWEDHRVGRPILYGGRVAADGSSLDGFGFPILDLNSKRDYQPSVASDGTQFLVVTARTGEILGVRVSATGEVLDLDPIVIASPEILAWPPSLMFDGEQYVVAWSEGTSPPGPDNGIRWARVQPDGTVLDPDGVFVYPMAIEITRVGVSFDGAGYLLSWADFDADAQTKVVVAGRVAPDGTPIDETPIRISPIGVNVEPKRGPVAGFDGTNHVIAWTNRKIVNNEWDEEAEEYRIRAARLAPDGALLDPDGILVFHKDGEFVWVDRLDIAAGGGRSLLVWSVDGQDSHADWARPVDAAQLAADGTVTAYPKDTFPRGLSATVEVHAEGGLMLWQGGDYEEVHHPILVGTRLDAAGMPLADGAVSPATCANQQVVTAAAFGMQRFFVLWDDTRDPPGNRKKLHGARLAIDGTPLDAEPLRITNEWAWKSNVVFDGANFVVTWVRFPYDYYRVARVSPAGDLLDAKPVEMPLDSEYGKPSGASDGTHTLLLGQTKFPFGIAAAIVDQQLELASDVVHLIQDDMAAPSGALASFDGIDYLVVWQETKQIGGRRINQAGALEGDRITIVDDDNARLRAIASGDGVNLVVWTSGTEIRATRVDVGGQVLDPDGFLVTNALWHDGHSAAFDGTSFVVAWRVPVDLHAAVVTTQGEVSPTFSISTEPVHVGPPFLAGADGRVLAAYTRFVPGAPHDAHRVHGRVRSYLSTFPLDIAAPVPKGKPPANLLEARPLERAREP